MKRNPLLAVLATKRPPEMPDLGAGSDWKFETRALAADFKRFDVRAEASDNPVISIFDYIGDDGEGGGVSLKKVTAILRNLRGRDITVEMNSPGGNYFEGVAIYNALRRHEGVVTVQVLGVAASAASVIAMAGDRIEIAHNAEIMIHEARGLFLGTKSEMKEAVATLEHLDGAMCATYAARSGRDAAEFANMIAGHDVYFQGQEAIDMGLADALMEREAAMPVYASADEFPSDKASLDRYLADHQMPHSARRKMFRAIGSGPQGPTPPKAAERGDDEAAIKRLLEALKV